MKAIVNTKFGPPDLLQLAEVEKPVPKDNEVLIRVHATTVSTGDCNIRDLTFAPTVFKFPARLFMIGITKPRLKILGSELAGEIEVAGKDVTRFRKGDQIFGCAGTGFGAHAEYTCKAEDEALALKPTNVSYEEAAAVPFGAHTALYYLRDTGNIQAGQKILINGASGSVGTYAVQLAKYFGAEVTGVCSTTNVELVKSLGADTVVDYTREDFTKSGETYDIIFDVVGKGSFSCYKGSLKPTGIFLACIIDLTTLVQMGWTSLTGGKKVKGGVASERAEDMMFFKGLIEQGKFIPVIDRRYPLEQTAEAFEYVEKGHKKGNVVITVDHDDKS